MVSRIHSCTLVGIDAAIVEVEAEISKGLPYYNVVGLPAQSVREAAVRIKTALNTIGYDVPKKRVTVNLAPADLRKPGSALDLPIAVYLGGTLLSVLFSPEPLASTTATVRMTRTLPAEPAWLRHPAWSRPPAGRMFGGSCASRACPGGGSC